MSLGDFGSTVDVLNAVEARRHWMLKYGSDGIKWYVLNRNGITNEICSSVPIPAECFPFAVESRMDPCELRRAFALWCLDEMVTIVRCSTCFEFQVIYAWALIDLLILQGKTVNPAHGVVGRDLLWAQEFDNDENRNLLTVAERSMFGLMIIVLGPGDLPILNADDIHRGLPASLGDARFDLQRCFKLVSKKEPNYNFERGHDCSPELFIQGPRVFRNHITKNPSMAYYLPTGDVKARSVVMIALMVDSLLTLTEARLVDIPDVDPRTLKGASSFEWYLGLLTVYLLFARSSANKEIAAKVAAITDMEVELTDVKTQLREGLATSNDSTLTVQRLKDGLRQETSAFKDLESELNAVKMTMSIGEVQHNDLISPKFLTLVIRTSSRAAYSEHPLHVPLR